MDEEKKMKKWWDKKQIPETINGLLQSIEKNNNIKKHQKKIIIFCIQGAYKIGDIHPQDLVSVRTLGHIFERLYTDFQKSSRTGNSPKKDAITLLLRSSNDSNPIESCIQILEDLKNMVDPTFR